MARQAVIVNAYSYRNAGDAAIMLSTSKLLKSLGYDSVCLATRYVEDKDSYSKWAIDVYGPLTPFPNRNGERHENKYANAAIANSLAIVIALFSPRVRRRLAKTAVFGWVLPQLARLAASDVAVVAGGGYFYSSRRRINLSLAHACLSSWLCTRFAAKTVTMPMSVGPITKRSDQQLVKWALRDVNYVAYRERFSVLASRFPVSIDGSAEVPDVAFIAAADPSIENGQLAEFGQVRIVAMDWRWSKSSDPDRFPQYITHMATLADALTTQGIKVVLGGHSSIPEHGQDDIEICRLIADQAAHKIEVDVVCEVGHLYQKYAQARLVVGTRLHACIMAVSVGTPAIALGYQEKAEGTAIKAKSAISFFRADSFDPNLVLQEIHHLFTVDVGVETSRLLAEIESAYEGVLR